MSKSTVDANIRAYLRQGVATPDKFSEMEAAIAGSQHPDAVRARKLIDNARQVPDNKGVIRMLYLERAWKLASDLVGSEKAAQVQRGNANSAKLGGMVTADKFAKPDLDTLIRGYLERGDPMPVKMWVDEYGTSKSALYRRIARIKEQ